MNAINSIITGGLGSTPPALLIPGFFGGGYVAPVTILETAETALYRILSAIPGVKAYPYTLPDMPTMPAITYQRISTDRANTLSGTGNLENVRFQLDIYGGTYRIAKSLALSVVAIMAASTMTNLLVGEDEDFEPDTQLFRVIQDYSCWYSSGSSEAGGAPVTPANYILKPMMDGQPVDFVDLVGVSESGEIVVNVRWPETIEGGAL